MGHSDIDNINDISTDYSVPMTIFDKNFITKFPSRKFWSERVSHPHETINVYTDGSNQTEGVGTLVQASL